MPLLTLIVPTHERFRYARDTVTNILRVTSDVEVVISDTSRNDEWQQLDPALLASGRLKIVRPGPGLSVVDNFNIGLSHATGTYLCFIGDDDLITPDIEPIVRWAAANDVDAIKFSFPILFYWADYRHRSRPEDYAGTIWASPFTGRVQRHDARAALDEAKRKLGRGVFDMPRAYCGIVSAELAGRIVERHGALFGGVSPDIYSAALISAEARHCVRIDYPAIIPGASSASTAGQSAAGTHVGALRDNAHVGAFRNLAWDLRVPEFYSVPTVWAYSLVKAVEVLDPEIEGRPHVSWGRLYAICLLFYRNYWSQTRRAMGEQKRLSSFLRLVRSTAAGILSEFAWLAGRVVARIRPKPGNVTIVKNVNDARQALDAVGAMLLGKSADLSAELKP
jgi:hypothetical protein